MQEVSVPKMSFISERLQMESSRKEKREIQRDFKDNARDQCSRDGSSYQKDSRRRRAGKERERDTTRLQGQCKRSVFQRWTFISERLQKETSRKGKREMQRDFKDNAREQCFRDGPSYQKDYRRRRAGRERERDNETSRIMQKDQCSRDGPSYQKDYRRRRAEREERGATRLQGQCKRSVFQRWIFKNRKITEGVEQEGKERGTTRLQGQYKRSVFQTWIFIS